jgi:putative ABC transport system ATP-binding protein
MSELNCTLVVQDLARHYDGGAVAALDGVSFEAAAGEVLALMGPSGCGKSTLLSLIGLLDRPTRGRVVIDGIDLEAIKQPARFRARTIGFVFQFHHLIPTMSLLENVCAPLIALGVPRPERTARAMAMLEQVDLQARAHFLPSRLSGGERQRGAVGRALVTHPRIVLADEPTGNLDSQSGETVVRLLADHAHVQGALVIIATHNPEVSAVADRTLLLRDGKISAIQRRGHSAPGIVHLISH